MNDLEPFAVAILIASLALVLAVASSRVSAILGIPAPVVFLVGAAITARLAPSVGQLSVQTDQRLVTVALAIILFDGGMHIGLSRMRPVLGAVVWLGTAGTLVTAGAMALAAHGLFGFGWREALLVGTALAPTDPAVVFSVLGSREITGRTGTLLEGESGANDPVGIAVMVSVLSASGSGIDEWAIGVGRFALQMGVGLVVGVGGGWLLLRLLRHARLPNEALYALGTVATALLIYGVATVGHGSGFLAVFVAGIVMGDERAPYKREIDRFSGAAATLAEMVAFVVLGLSIPLAHLFSDGRVWTGLALAAVLILVVRPLLVGLVVWPIRLRPGERAFVLWAGLKGAVPILLGTYVLSDGVHGADRIYGVIVVVVTVSVVVQGGLVPVVARRLGVPMRARPPS